MIGIRAPKGLGDAVHLRAAVLHLLAHNEKVKVFTAFPDVFNDLPVTIGSIGEGDEHPGLRHFVHKLGEAGKDIDAFIGACLRAGIVGPVELSAKWKVKNPTLLSTIMDAAKGRDIFVYQPRKIAKNPSQELLRPAGKSYNNFIADHHDHFRVKIGHPPYCEEDRTVLCELDLFGKTSIKDAFDIATIGDLFFGESCFVPMIGEAMDKRYSIMFTRRALNSDDRVRFMTPARLFHKKHLATAVYDES